MKTDKKGGEKEIKERGKDRKNKENMERWRGREREREGMMLCTMFVNAIVQ